MPRWSIIEGDCRERMAEMPTGSVHCIVTSPPYFGLRNYEVDGQIGLEESPEAYVDNLVQVFREAWRVLRDDGTLWLNLGDSYWGGKGQSGYELPHEAEERRAEGRTFQTGHNIPGYMTMRPTDGKHVVCKPKDLIGIPWRVAFALQADGWYLRSDIIWHKKSCMPESVTDRPTKSHEYIFLLTKKPRYYYDAEAVKEQIVSPPKQRTKHNGESAVDTKVRGYDTSCGSNSSGRNKRDVWTLGPEPFKDAHFATFPTEIPRLCISAGTSENGVCPKCGSPWKRVVERKAMVITKSERGKSMGEYGRTATSGTMVSPAESKTVGWQPTCACDAGEPVPATVLDPFSGAGTTVMVALRLGRNGIGVELNPKYAEMSRKRIVDDCPMLNTQVE